MTKGNPLASLHRPQFTNMAQQQQQPDASPGVTVDPKSGYSPDTKIYHSLRPPVPLPPHSRPLSVYDYALSLLLLPQSPPYDLPFVVSSSKGHTLSYRHFLRLVDSLSSSLSSLHSLSPEDVAFVLCPPSLHIPVLYFALLRLRVVISPSNPLSTPQEVSHQLSLSCPTVAFATSSTYHLLTPSHPFPRGLFLLDSPAFLSLLSSPPPPLPRPPLPPLPQSHPAAILFSSGTTGRVKGVVLTHRNLIALLSGLFHQKPDNDDDDQDIPSPASLFTLPLFHVFGFFSMIRVFAFGETMVLMDERFELEALLRVVSRYRVTGMPVSPPLIVALAKSELTRKYDLSSLRTVACGGAPLGKEVAERFREKFPNIEIVQGYGMTETSGAATRTLGPDETSRHGSAGRLAENLEAKIVDPETGEGLPPGGRGELWLRGPIVMKGYVGDDRATAGTLTSDGWLKTGDLCYFDPEGFLYIVDRLKELIKYKAYQVPPAELERLLHSCPEIADAAVIPYPDEEAGEIPMALVVRKPGSSISESEVIDFVAKQVAPYKKVRRVGFMDSIPKSPAGKILRRDLIKLSFSIPSARL